MLTAYIEEAMRQATYERIEDGSVFGSIPGFAGLWADADTEEACQRELRDAWRAGSCCMSPIIRRSQQSTASRSTSVRRSDATAWSYQTPRTDR